MRSPVGISDDPDLGRRLSPVDGHLHLEVAMAL